MFSDVTPHVDNWPLLINIGLEIFFKNYHRKIPLYKQNLKF